MCKRGILIILGSLMIVLGACREMREEQTATAPQRRSMPRQQAQTTDMPPADAQALWRYLTVTDPYTEWEYWPGKEGIYPGQSPHGAYLRLYANPIAVRAAKAGNTAMPDGAILVKENYGEDRSTLMAITPMYRVRGYNPAGGDWFWAKYQPNGTIDEAGRLEGCISCHASAPGNNWIFTEPASGN